MGIILLDTNCVTDVGKLLVCHLDLDTACEFYKGVKCQRTRDSRSPGSAQSDSICSDPQVFGFVVDQLYV